MTYHLAVFNPPQEIIGHDNIGAGGYQRPTLQMPVRIKRPGREHQISRLKWKLNLNMLLPLSTRACKYLGGRLQPPTTYIIRVDIPSDVSLIGAYDVSETKGPSRFLPQDRRPGPHRSDQNSDKMFPSLSRSYSCLTPRSSPQTGEIFPQLSL